MYARAGSSVSTGRARSQTEWWWTQRRSLLYPPGWTISWRCCVSRWPHPFPRFGTPALRPATGWWSSAAVRSVCSQSTPASSAGIEVALVEPVDERRVFACRSRRGRDLRVGDEVAAYDADLAIDAVGIEPTWQAGISAVRMGGTVTIVGLGQSEGRFSVGDVVRRGITVRGHYAYTRSDFDAALEPTGRPIHRQSSGCARCR